MNCNNQILISSGFTKCDVLQGGCRCNNSQFTYYQYVNPTNKLKVKLQADGKFQILNGAGLTLQFGKITDTDDSQLIDRLGKV